MRFQQRGTLARASNFGLDRSYGDLALNQTAFAPDELAAIDAHAVEGHIDLWRDVASS